MDIFVIYQAGYNVMYCLLVHDLYVQTSRVKMKLKLLTILLIGSHRCEL